MIRRVAIFYVGNKSLESVANMSFMAIELENEFAAQGKVIDKKIMSPKGKSITYTDGSCIETIPIGVGVLDKQFTETYIDKGVVDIPNGNIYIHDVIIPVTKYQKENVYMYGRNKENGLYIEKL